MMSQLVSYSVSGKNPHDDVTDTFSNFAIRKTISIENDMCLKV